MLLYGFLSGSSHYFTSCYLGTKYRSRLQKPYKKIMPMADIALYALETSSVAALQRFPNEFGAP